MEVFAVEQQLCPCYTERQEFQKLVELKDNSLVVYCHRTCTDNIRQAEVVDSVKNTSRDVLVFILHNKKDVKITTSQLTSELEKKNVSCPRCRKRFEHVQKLMKEVKSIDKKIVMSICDQCRKRPPVNKKTFCACEKIVNLFKTVIGKQTEEPKKYLKVLPSKMGYLRKTKEKKICAYSDSQIYQDINSPALGHEPEIQQMFYSDTHFQLDDTEMSETESKGVCINQTAAFIESFKPMQTSFVHTPHELKKNYTNIPISLVDSDTTFVETYVGVNELPRLSIENRNQEKKIKDTPSIDAKEELKRRHDISLRQMIKLEKDSRASFFILKRPDVYETPKIAPWVQKEPTPKYHMEPKHDRESQNLEYVSNRLIKFGSSKNIQKNLQDFEESKHDKYLHDKIKKGLYVSDHYISSAVKLSRSVEKPQFSFVFPKEEEKKEKYINPDVSSSELIKVTQERLRLESERLKRKQKEERQQELEREQKMKLAREEKKRQAEEKKRLAEDEKKKIAEEQQRLTKRHISRDFILGKKGRSDVVKKDTESKLEHDEQDGVKEKAMVKVGDQSKPDEIDEGVEKEEKFKTEEEQYETEEEQNEIETKESITKKKEITEKLQSDKQTKILRDKNQKEDIKGNLKLEKSLRKVTFSKAEKLIKKKQDIYNNLEISTTNINETLNKEISRKKMLTEKDLSIIKKEKEQALKKKQHLELEAQKLELEAKRKAIEESKMSKKLMNKADSIKILKQVKTKEVCKMRPSNIDPELLESHKRYHNKSGQKSSGCPVCFDSELELDVLSLDYKKRNLKKDTIRDIIIGEKIYKSKARHENIIKSKFDPVFFPKEKSLESDHQLMQMIEQAPEPVKKKMISSTSIKKKKAKQVEMEPSKGMIRYALSDPIFIDKGWTLLPTQKVVRKINLYRMRPARPEFDWFKHNKNKEPMTYDTGERLAEFDDNGRGRWYYRNGRLALDYYDAEETNAQQRFVIYSSGERDESGRTHPITILATFDYLGNGIVFDHAGKIRLKYNQTEGVVLDRAIGPVSRWKWHSLNDPPVLQQIMIDTQMPLKDPDILRLESPEQMSIRQDCEEMLAIEYDNFTKENIKKFSKTFKPFQIKMKALKINEHFSLKVLEQATVYLIFRDGLTNLRINIGMILDDKEIVDTDTWEMDKVSNSLERFPARTDSLASLQRSVAHAQRYERQHAERERRLRPPEPCASVDLMTAATCPPMRPRLRTVLTDSSSTAESPCKKTFKQFML